jgi:hypothetical protein
MIILLEYLVDLVADVAAARVRGKGKPGIVVELIEL